MKGETSGPKETRECHRCSGKNHKANECRFMKDITCRKIGRNRAATATTVKYSEWAVPVIHILKWDGSIQLCGDYKLTVNTVSTLEQYPIPRVEDLFALLDGGKKFTKLDMSHTYQQIIMNENSKKYLMVNIHTELFTYNHLLYGVALMPGIFQRTM